MKDVKEFSFEVRDQSALPDGYPIKGIETCYFLTRKTSNNKTITVKVTVTDHPPEVPNEDDQNENSDPESLKKSNGALTNFGSSKKGNCFCFPWKRDRVKS